MYENLLRSYGILCVAEGSTLNFGYWDKAKIWLIDPRVLLDDDKIALIIETLGNDAHLEDIEYAKVEARKRIDQNPEVLWPSAFS